MQTRLVKLDKPIRGFLIDNIKSYAAKYNTITLSDGTIIRPSSAKDWTNILLIKLDNVYMNQFPGCLIIHYKFQEMLNFIWASYDDQSLIFTIPHKSLSDDWKNFLGPINDKTGEFTILNEYPDQIDNAVVPFNAPPEFKFQLIESYIRSVLMPFGVKINDFWSGKWTGINKSLDDQKKVN